MLYKSPLCVCVCGIRVAVFAWNGMILKACARWRCHPLIWIWCGQARWDATRRRRFKVTEVDDLATLCFNLISWSVVFFCVSSKEMLHKSPSMLFVFVYITVFVWNELMLKHLWTKKAITLDLAMTSPGKARWERHGDGYPNLWRLTILLNWGHLCCS